MVDSLNFENVQPEQAMPIPLTDKEGTPLASGVYYLAVDSGGKHWVVKLLVLK